MKYISILMISAALLMSSCIDEVTPGAGYITDEQLQSSAASQAALLPGIAACMTSCYYNGDNTCSGYPGQMYLRECFGEDFALSDDYYSYYAYYENGNMVTYLGYYIMRFYYDLIGNCNNVIRNASAGVQTDASRQSLGIALGYRAMAYMDLARYFEYQPTGYSDIDNEALKMEWPKGIVYDDPIVKGCTKLTVSIVTENTTPEQTKHNPRVPFYTIYRFLMNDLNTAEDCLKNASNVSLIYPNLQVIYGLKARLWLEMASRFELMPEDLQAQLRHEGDNDGYAALGLKSLAQSPSATDCYALAADYAQKAMVGYSPMTRATYQNRNTGFNTADPNSWMWIMRNASKDEFEDLYYYYSFLGQMVSEPSWGMAQYGGLFRCISKALYDKISVDANDWRLYSYVSPDVAGQEETPEDYAPYTTLPYTVKVGSTTETYTWDKLPAYANLKFRSRSLTDSYDGRVADYPLMRMEEMIFIHAEAVAHTQDVAAGAQEITDFVNNYRHIDPTNTTYTCSQESMSKFMNDLMIQKRIEFWGEGIMMWDYKRLKRGINRAYEGTNYLSKYRMRTADGYVVPWMNIRFPSEYEGVANQAAMGTPDPSQVVQAE